MGFVRRLFFTLFYWVLHNTSVVILVTFVYWIWRVLAFIVLLQWSRDPGSSCLWIFTTSLVMATKTARKTMCHDWAFKGYKVQPGFQFSPALREWESVGIRLRPLGNVAYVACLLLLCQGSKWLNGRSVWLAFRRSWFRIPTGSRIFFHGFTSHSLSKNIIIHDRLLSIPVNNIKPLKPRSITLNTYAIFLPLKLKVITYVFNTENCVCWPAFWVIYRKATKGLTNLVTWYCLVFRPPNLLDTNSKSV